MSTRWELLFQHVASHGVRKYRYIEISRYFNSRYRIDIPQGSWTDGGDNNIQTVVKTNNTERLIIHKLRASITAPPAGVAVEHGMEENNDSC